MRLVNEFKEAKMTYEHLIYLYIVYDFYSLTEIRSERYAAANYYQVKLRMTQKKIRTNVPEVRDCHFENR